MLLINQPVERKEKYK